MAVGKGDLVQEWELRARAREIWQRDFTDLNREMAGVQGSRINRFTSRAADFHAGNEKEENTVDDFWTLLSWLDQMSETYRQSYERLSRTIDDAQKAYLLVLEDIQRQKEEATLALEEIRENALVLEDGRRVYFTKDQSQLFDDDGEEITDQDTIEEAREAQVRNPNASSHADNQAEKDRLQMVKQHEDEIFEKLREMEELKTRMENGDLSQEDLDRKNQAIRAGMSPDARKIFDRLQGDSTNMVDGDTQNIPKNPSTSLQHPFEKAGNGDLNAPSEPTPAQSPIPLPLNFQS